MEMQGGDHDGDQTRRLIERIPDRHGRGIDGHVQRIVQYKVECMYNCICILLSGSP